MFHGESVPEVEKHLRDRGLETKVVLLLDNA